MKWFTYCGTEEASRWDSTAKRYFREQHVGLLFGTDDGEEVTEDDLHSIVNDPLTEQLLGSTYYVHAIEKGRYILSPDVTMGSHIPDAGSIDGDDDLFVVENRTMRPVSLRQRYNRCLSLLKAVGCLQCPEVGRVCMNRDLKTPITLNLTDAMLVGQKKTAYQEAIPAKLKHRATTIGGFTFTSPVMTKATSFASALRDYDDHHFDRVEEWTQQRKTASTDAAVSRDFKKHNCDRCFALAAGCTAYRNCPGRYPDEDTITELLVKRWKEELLPQQKTYALWQFWALVRGAGRNTRIGRSTFALTGPYMSYRGWTVGMVKTSGKPEVNYFDRPYEFYAEHFDLPRNESDERMKYFDEITDPKTLALLSLVIDKHFGNEHSTFRNGRVCDSVAWRVPEPSYRAVSIKWYGKSSLKHDSSIKEYEDYWRLFKHELPVQRIDYVKRRQDQNPDKSL